MSTYTYELPQIRAVIIKEQRTCDIKKKDTEGNTKASFFINNRERALESRQGIV